MKVTINPFQTRQIGSNIVEVWVGTPGEAESEFVCSVGINLVPQLIATLRKIEGKRKPIDPRDKLIKSVDIIGDR
jgi:hypothetical protein